MAEFGFGEPFDFGSSEAAHGADPGGVEDAGVDHTKDDGEDDVVIVPDQVVEGRPIRPLRPIYRRPGPEDEAAGPPDPDS